MEKDFPFTKSLYIRIFPYIIYTQYPKLHLCIIYYKLCLQLMQKFMTFRGNFLWHQIQHGKSHAFSSAVRFQSLNENKN